MHMLTKSQLEFLDKHTQGTWKINSDGLVDVDGNFLLNDNDIDLTDLKMIKLGRISGNFSCSNNQLQTLEGAPQEVGGDFYCYNNQLQTLEGSPQEVGGDFYCSNNQLRTLEGAPLEVVGNFYCYGNQLRTLEGAPETIGGEIKSGHFNVPRGEWSIVTLVSMFLDSLGEKKDLLGTLVSPETLQKKIDKNPEKMAVELKSILRIPEYRGLKWPESLKGEVDLLTNLDQVGF